MLTQVIPFVLKPLKPEIQLLNRPQSWSPRFFFLLWHKWKCIKKEKSSFLCMIVFNGPVRNLQWVSWNFIEKSHREDITLFLHISGFLMPPAAEQTEVMLSFCITSSISSSLEPQPKPCASSSAPAPCLQAEVAAFVHRELRNTRGRGKWRGFWKSWESFKCSLHRHSRLHTLWSLEIFLQSCML